MEIRTDEAELTYLQARVASISGDHARSAALLATLADAQPDQVDLARRAIGEAISAGQMELAVRLAREIPPAKLTSDARLLLAAEELRRNRPERALHWLSVNADNGALDFLTPLVNAWTAASRGDLKRALETVDQVPAGSLLGPLRAEQRAFILLKFRKPAEAEPFAQRAIAAAGGRESRLRLALADGFVAAGDQARALALLEPTGSDGAAARQRVLSRKSLGQVIDTPAKAFSEVLAAFAADVARLDRVAAPVGLVQVARYANPQNSSAAVLLALLLDDQGRSDEALTALRSVPQGDALEDHVRDIQVRILSDKKRFGEAYAIAQAGVSSGSASAGDYSRLGDLYQAMKRPAEAADAYWRAISLSGRNAPPRELWPLYLLRANALEEANRWPEAKQSLEQGLAIAPDQPLLLNFLGYAKLERGEDMDNAEKLIRKASELAPDDASITDSLGWAQFKRGKVAEAIETLQRAAEKDPDQAEIQEHLGDALYKSGQRFQARFAWNAALLNADDEIAARIRAKLATGLTPANAAP